MSIPKSKHRIEILDGFRTIAILSVILFHFLSRYANMGYYPYGIKYDFFSYGSLGVHFFFIISGFVISFTLENTSTFVDFWKRRFIRLYPSMIIASVLIFLFMSLFDKKRLFENAHELKNFIPSISFLPPAIFKNLASSEWTKNLNYLNLSFWSLWPEIQFYFVSSILYFFSKEKFIRNLSITAIVIMFMYLLSTQLGFLNHKYTVFVKIFTFAFSVGRYISYFILGALFFELFKRKQSNEVSSPRINIAFFCFIVIHFSITTNHNIATILVNIGMLILFGLFIYYPKYIRFLENKYVIEIGLSSYFLYLIHEPIGVMLINGYAKYFQPFEFLFIILLITALCIVSVLYYKKIEKKLTKLLYLYFF